MPMILSACLRSSFFTRVAAGEADGDACGVGVGVCASVISGALVATIAAAPAAGRTFTKARRVIDLRFDLFIGLSKLPSLTVPLVYCQLPVRWQRHTSS